MSETPPENQPPENGNGGHIPRLAVGVVVLGLIVSLAVYALSFLPGNGSEEIAWDTVEPIKSPSAKAAGGGSLAVTRTSLAALAPNEDGLLLYRVAGAIRIESNGRKTTQVRCDVTSRVAGDTRIARSTRLRAAWPKPSDDLQAQEVPETSFVKYATADANKVDLPIRDVARRYIDADVPVTVDWDSYIENSQNWVWHLDDGTGAGAATLPWLVIFEADNRPRGTIRCSATIGSGEAKFTIPFRQQEWPIADDQPNPGETDSGTAPNVG